jgi:cysteinyl-tRNA synthetase
MAAFFELAKELNKATADNERLELAARMYAAGHLMGFLTMNPDAWFAGDDSGGDYTAEAIEALLEERRNARGAKDFARADAIRDELAQAGIQIEDGPDGTTWRRS